MKLICGDCIEAMRQIPDGSIDMVLADPPYGTTANKWDRTLPLEKMWWELRRVIRPNGAICLFAQQPFATDLINGSRREFRYEWVWEKVSAQGFLNANRMPLRAHELVLVFYKKLPTYHPQLTKGKPYKGSGESRMTSNYHTRRNISRDNDGFRYPRDVQKFDGERGLHPTQKPVALLEYLIRTYTDPGEIVLDFTMGSGSTGVACVNTDREFIGIELDKGYFDLAKKRIEERCRSINAAADAAGG